MNNKEIGDFGELLASKYLKDKGYEVIERNFRTKSGEIDIIAIKNKVLTFVEVKTRKNDSFAFAREAVNYKKQKNIKNTARGFISTNYINYDEISFDIIEVYTEEKTLEHYKNVF